MNNEAGLPIAVISPITRYRFYNTAVAPTILENRCRQIIKVPDPHRHGAAGARNAGFEHCRQEYVFFLDDDTLLRPYTLEYLYRALERNKRASFAYCDWMVCNHPTRGNEIIRPGAWDPVRLQKENYISTMTLIRSEVFARYRWDPELRMFQDWDLWLRMVADGHNGAYTTHHMHEPLFTAIYGIDGHGITKRDPESRSATLREIRRRQEHRAMIENTTIMDEGERLPR